MNTTPTRNFFSAPVWALGFRPFFLLAGLFAVVAMLLWGFVLAGHGPMLEPFWHGHEMLFGYTGAVIAGFLLTAAANWTGRATLVGASLAAIVLVWVAARIVVALPAAPDGLKAALCAGFFVFLALGVGRPIVATGKRRNYGILAVLGVYAALELVYWLAPSMRLHVLEAVLLFIMVMVAIIGGRVLPAFTRNATPGLRVRPGGLWRDRTAMASLVGLAILALIPQTPSWLFAAVAAFGAVAHGLRMLGWGGEKTFARPILWVLHLSYLCLPVGLALFAAQASGASIPFWVPLHVLAVGALGLMTLGMMSRVTLGHTGRLIVANKATTLAYVLLIAAVVVRAAGPSLGAASWQTVMLVAVGLWSLAFLVFFVAYAPKLLAPRPDGKPG
ncbi:MAG: NnrS family protein [Gammaproteobacteria bacterium]|nr:NnrS family protein [Gammaproteobacteria bacterium]